VSDFSDFGRFLSQQRELRGLSRDEVAKATRIPPTLIAALEDGQSERLPERVFVVNYIRSYATTVGLEPDEVLNRFHEIPGTLPPTEQSPKVLEQARRKSALFVAMVVGAVVVLAMIALWWWTQSQIAAQLKP
jgi:cytoskeletal protein RodZ